MTNGFKFFTLAALAVGVIGLAACSDNIKDAGSAAPVDPLKLTLQITNVPAAAVGTDFAVVTFNSGWSDMSAKAGTLAATTSVDLTSSKYFVNPDPTAYNNWNATQGANTIFQIARVGADATTWGDMLISDTDSTGPTGGNIMVTLLGTAAGKVSRSQFITIDLAGATADTTNNTAGRTASGAIDYVVDMSKIVVSNDNTWDTTPKVDPKTLTLKITNVPTAAVGTDFAVVTFNSGWSDMSAKAGTLAATTSVDLTSSKYYVNPDSTAYNNWNATQGANTIFQIARVGADATTWGDMLISDSDSTGPTGGNIMVTLTGDAAGKIDTAQIITIDLAGATADTTNNTAGRTASGAIDYVVAMAKITAAADTSWK